MTMRNTLFFTLREDTKSKLKMSVRRKGLEECDRSYHKVKGHREGEKKMHEFTVLKGTLSRDSCINPFMRTDPP